MPVEAASMTAPGASERAEKLHQFLGTISQGDEKSRMITPHMAAAVPNVLGKLNASIGLADGLSIPVATPGPEGQLMLVWRSGPHYLELELFEHEPWDFFYNDESSGEMFVCEYAPDDPVPQRIVERLTHFVGNP